MFSLWALLDWMRYLSSSGWPIKTEAALWRVNIFVSMCEPCQIKWPQTPPKPHITNTPILISKSSPLAANQHFTCYSDHACIKYQTANTTAQLLIQGLFWWIQGSNATITRQKQQDPCLSLRNKLMISLKPHADNHFSLTWWYHTLFVCCFFLPFRSPYLGSAAVSNKLKLASGADAARPQTGCGITTSIEYPARVVGLFISSGR